MDLFNRPQRCGKIDFPQVDLRKHSGRLYRLNTIRKQRNQEGTHSLDGTEGSTAAMAFGCG